METSISLGIPRAERHPLPALGRLLPQHPGGPAASPGSSRLLQGPILSPAVLLPVCVAALLLPGGHPEPPFCCASAPGLALFPALSCASKSVSLRLGLNPTFLKDPSWCWSPCRQVPRGEGRPLPRALILCRPLSEELVQSIFAFATSPALLHSFEEGPTVVSRLY